MYYQGTIKAAAKLDCERQAEFLRKAMKGLGTDERRIIQILASHNNDQRQQISSKYKQMYGRDLTDDLKSELSGLFEDLVVSLMVPNHRFDALNLKKAIKGVGTDEKVLIEILCSKRNAEIKEIREIYKKEYGCDLTADVESDVSGHFKNVLISQLNGNREENEEIDAEKVNKDAQELYDAGEAIIGTYESVFNKVLCVRSFSHLRQVFDEYKKVSTKDIVDSIASETSGDLKDAFGSIVKYVRSPPDYFAERLHKTMKGAGTNDQDLIRLMVDRSELDLEDVKACYFKKYNQSLQTAVSQDTSGDYRSLFVAMLTGLSPP